MTFLNLSRNRLLAHLVRLAIRKRRVLFVTAIVGFIVALANLPNGLQQSKTNMKLETHPKNPVKANYSCPPSIDFILPKSEMSSPKEELVPDEQTDKKVLILVQTMYSKAGKEILEIFDSLKFDYKVEVLGQLISFDYFQK